MTPLSHVFYRDLAAALGRNDDATAWIAGNERCTYRELQAAVTAIAAVLADRRREAIVVLSDKSFSAYAAVFGVLLSGNVWVPLSPAQPAARAIDILRMTGTRLVLADEPPAPDLAEYCRAAGVTVVDLQMAAVSHSDEALAVASINNDDVAYIMFTSGSTGVPKGVPMTHANYINFVHNALELLPLRHGDVFSDYHDWGFDISIFYLFCAPLVGGALAPAMRPADRIMPLRYMQEAGITVWSSVPSSIARIRQMLPDEAPDTLVRVMFLCGEPFSLKVLDYCLNHMTIPHVYNFYGLTETGVENFWHECRPSDLVDYEPFGFVPIGRPLPGNDIAVTADKELLLAGCQITPGYLGGIGTDRFEVRDGREWFHTGDVVEQHGDVWFCKGRIDHQVKLSGYRIELMDIEVNIKRLEPSVEEAVCFTVPRGDHHLLMAALLPRHGVMVDAEDIRRRLARVLPGYMMPARIVVCPDMPVNANGKIDRGRLRERHSGGS